MTQLDNWEPSVDALIAKDGKDSLYVRLYCGKADDVERILSPLKKKGLQVDQLEDGFFYIDKIPLESDVERLAEAISETLKEIGMSVEHRTNSQTFNDPAFERGPRMISLAPEKLKSDDEATRSFIDAVQRNAPEGTTVSEEQARHILRLLLKGHARVIDSEWVASRLSQIALDA